ncbi:MAG: CsbD family protein [Gammaproteobacteria bacterium]
MNKNQVKGTAKDVAGKIQKEAGKLTNSPSQQIKGAAKQVEGKVQKGVGNAQQSAEDAEKRNRRH